MKQCLILTCLCIILVMSGCAATAIGGGAVGAFKVGTDERSIGRMWDDSTITAKVKSELIKNPVTKAFKIDVDALQGNITLTGVVESAEEAEQAVEIAKQVAGVKSVKNNLQIGSKSFGQTIDDNILGSRIKSKLIQQPGIRSFNIDVDVHNGVATLTGIVDSLGQKEQVVNIARSTKGIVNVVDNMSVKNP